MTFTCNNGTEYIKFAARNYKNDHYKKILPSDIEQGDRLSQDKVISVLEEYLVADDTETLDEKEKKSYGFIKDIVNKSKLEYKYDYQQLQEQKEADIEGVGYKTEANEAVFDILGGDEMTENNQLIAYKNKDDLKTNIEMSILKGNDKEIGKDIKSKSKQKQKKSKNRGEGVITENQSEETDASKGIQYDGSIEKDVQVEDIFTADNMLSLDNKASTSL